MQTLPNGMETWVLNYKLDCDFLWVAPMINQWTTHLLPVSFPRIPSVQHSFDNVVNAQRTSAV